MKLSQLALASLSAVTVLMSAAPAHALGLGRLNVQSSLGESLNAEIDIASMTPEEASSLEVRIASPETYRAAGVEYHPALASARVQLARRADGRPFLRVLGDRPVNEPFVDVILELNWAAGRLVREYTLLLDPSRNAMAQAPAAPSTPAQLSAPSPAPSAAPMAAVEPAPAATQQPEPVAVTRSTTVTESGIRITVEPIDPSATPRASAQPPARANARVPAAPARRAATATRAPARSAEAPGQITVRRGDTLSKIARQVQAEGASLDQMLVSMFRTNPEAFSGNNMNRLRAGAILRVPDAAEVQGTDAGEARQMIVAQSADFNAYRRRFASNVAAAPSAPARQSGGQIQASVDDKKQADAKTPDKLTLSQGAVTPPTAPEAKISLEAASKEASTRVAELSRNLDELKKVQGAASAEVAGGVKPSAPEAASAPAVAVPSPMVVDAKPAAADPAASAAPATAVAETAPPPAAPVAPATPVEVDDRSWFAKVFESPYALPIGAGLAVLLAAFGIYRVRARSRNAAAETSFMESRIQPDSFFGASGGQRVDTHDGVAGTPADPASSSMTYSLSQLDAIGDVDPVAEADVYLAYGRDLQAEEILKEAMRSNPDRLEIRTKLLEVYSKRKDAKSFESLASQLFTLTGGAGQDWQRAQELGRGLDPSNPLYADGGRPAHADAPVTPAPAARVVDLDSVEDLPSRAASVTEKAKAEATDIDIDLSFDAEPAKPASGSTWGSAPIAAAGAAAAAAAARVSDAVDSKFPGRAFQNSRMDAPAASNESAAFDLSDISLDLAKPADAQVAKSVADRAAEARNSGFVDLSGLPDDPESQFNDDGDPLERKLELAEEFRQIGDFEGARDLLNEVIAGADGAVRQKAQTMLDSLG